MNRTTWRRVIEEDRGFGPRTSVIVMIRNVRDHVDGVIREIDEDFLVLESHDDKRIKAIIDLSEVVGIRRGAN